MATALHESHTIGLGMGPCLTSLTFARPHEAWPCETTFLCLAALMAFGLTRFGWIERRPWPCMLVRRTSVHVCRKHAGHDAYTHDHKSYDMTYGLCALEELLDIFKAVLDDVISTRGGRRCNIGGLCLLLLLHLLQLPTELRGDDVE